MIRANILAFTNDANGHFPPPKKLHCFYDLFSQQKDHKHKILIVHEKTPLAKR